jgi:WS/DGAT/MGAT family acyltransferase
MSFPELRGARGPMSVVGAGLLWLERPHAPLTVAALATLAGSVRKEDLVREVEGRLYRLPRLLQRPLPFPLDLAYPSWEDSPGFRARDHVYRWGLPAGADAASLCEFAAQLMVRPLRTDRPLWELHLLEGPGEERCALLLKVHHCVLEGVAGTRMLELLLGRASERDARPPRAPTPQPPASTAQRLARALLDRHWRRVRWLRAALGSAALAGLREGLRATWESAGKLAEEIPRLPWNAPLGRRRRISLLCLSLAEVERIRRSQAATLDDALLAILAGGLHRFLAARGTDVLEVMALVPIPLPAAAGAGPGFSALRVRLPVRSGDERARLHATRSVVDRLQAQSAWSGTSGLLRAAELLPPPLFKALARRVQIGRIANLIAVHVPGPSEPRYLCGQRIESIHPLLPVIDNVGLSLAAYAYAGGLHLGLVADASALPDLDGLANAIQESFEKLRASA